MSKVNVFKHLYPILFYNGDIMAEYKIIFNKDACIGCSACVSACPDNWEMDGDKAKPKVIEIDESQLSCNKEAEDVCPVGAIKLEEIK